MTTACISSDNTDLIWSELTATTKAGKQDVNSKTSSVRLFSVKRSSCIRSDANATGMCQPWWMFLQQPVWVMIFFFFLPTPLFSLPINLAISRLIKSCVITDGRWCFPPCLVVSNEVAAQTLLLMHRPESYVFVSQIRMRWEVKEKHFCCLTTQSLDSHTVSCWHNQQAD